jgi:hypothetical protein
MKRIALYAGIAGALILVSAFALSLAFDGPADRRSILVSATLAFVVQLAAFAAIGLASAGNVVTGWGIGVLIRFLVLVAYAFLVVQSIGLAPAAALISLATFFFLCTLVEPLVLLRT